MVFSSYFNADSHRNAVISDTFTRQDGFQNRDKAYCEFVSYPARSDTAFACISITEASLQQFLKLRVSLTSKTFSQENFVPASFFFFLALITSYHNHLFNLNNIFENYYLIITY